MRRGSTDVDGFIAGLEAQGEDVEAALVALDEKATAIVATTMRNATKMSFLNEKMGPRAVKILARGLSESEVTEVDLSQNSLGNKGARHIGELFKAASNRVTDVFLNLNHISDDGAAFLSAGHLSSTSRSNAMTLLSLTCLKNKV